MDALAGTVAFFDIGNTLASVVVAPSGDRIERLTVYPEVPSVLGELSDRGVRLGIISDRGPIPAEQVNQALETAGILGFFEPALVVYGKKDSPRVFELAATQAGAPDPARRLLFVGEDPAERAQALRADFVVAPHPRLALPVLEQQAPLRYVRVTVPREQATSDWRAVLSELPLLPLRVTDHAQTTVYAITTTPAAARLDDLGFLVDRLGVENEPLATDLYLLRDDRQRDSGFLQPEGNSSSFFEGGAASRRVLASDADGLLVTIPADRSVDSYHFPQSQHGHTLKLAPSLTLLGAFDADANPRLAGVDTAPLAAVGAALGEAEIETLHARVDGQQLAGHVERYSGARQANPSGTLIESRHIHHLGNADAVGLLVGDLERIGAGRLVVGRHRFSHEGRPLENVEAELPGRDLEGIVLVTAHLDSTAFMQLGFRPALDPAPGADDDASGVAGVLAAADAIQALDAATPGLPRRTIRFVLFNAEEQGLVGSGAYARNQAALGAPIVAVLQMDMIGFDVIPDRTFELHAGFTPSASVQAQSLNLAQTIAELRPQVSPQLSAPQLYPAHGDFDLAEGRSDHHSFHQAGYAACLASEDLFVGPGSGAPPAEPNPNYHRPTDTAINAAYAADIARLVTAAAWVAATR
jgi:leucyl aminopeptidase